MIEAAIYLVFFVLLAAQYRRLRSRDDKSLAYQARVEARLRELPFTYTRKHHEAMILVGMIAAFLLLLYTAVGYLA